MEQVFGPIVGIQSVREVKEVEKLINQSKYCLRSSVYSRDQTTIDYLERELNVGTVCFNQVPLFPEPTLPVSGRYRNAKLLQGSKHCFKAFANLKSVNLIRL